MARPKKAYTTAEQIEQAEMQVIKTKEAYDTAVEKLKELREKYAKNESANSDSE